MALPQVIAIAPESPAARAGVVVGDEIRSMNGVQPKDVIEYRVLAEEAALVLELARGGLEVEVEVRKGLGEPLGIEVSSPVFDRVRTCDNHCSFCFIYQLPKGLRKSLYVKDDDYRLSFLYGNFTTLTRFTELDLERVLSERLSPLHVSIHATDPQVRARLLRNRRGATSLRWLGQLLSAGITVHGQIVLCPGLNDGAVLEDTLASVLERFPQLASLAVVPLGISRFTREPELRAHRPEEAAAALDLIEEWQELYVAALGRPLVYGADELYLLAGRPFPALGIYGDLAQHENGIGMAAAFAASFAKRRGAPSARAQDFFRSVDGAPASGYRARRVLASSPPARASARDVTVHVITGRYGAAVLAPLLVKAGRDDVRLVAVENHFFGGNIAVTGLLVGRDIAAALATLPAHDRYLLPDVCLSEGRFLDGTTLEDLPRPVEVIETTGVALARALDARRPRELALSR